MYTVFHAQVTAKVGEPIRIVYTVKDNAGATVDVSSGVTGTYKIARRAGEAALLTLTTELIFSGSTVTVAYNTNQVLSSTVQCLGDFFDQLKLVKTGDTLYICEGIVTIDPVIS